MSRPGEILRGMPQPPLRSSCGVAGWPARRPRRAAWQLARHCGTDASSHRCQRSSSVDAGFAGHFKVGYWTPLEVDLEAGTTATRPGRTDRTRRRRRAQPRTRARGRSIAIGPGEHTTVALFAKIGQLQGDIVVGFRGDDGALPRNVSPPAPRTWPASRPPAAVDRGGGQSRWPSATWPSSATTAHRVASVERSISCPATGGARKASSTDAVALPTAIAPQLPSTSPQLAALDLGSHGRPLVMRRSQAEELLAAGSPLARLAPGTFDSLVPLRPSTALKPTPRPPSRLGCGIGSKFECPSWPACAAASRPTPAAARAICRWWSARRTASAKWCSRRSIWTRRRCVDWAAGPAARQAGLAARADRARGRRARWARSRRWASSIWQASSRRARSVSRRAAGAVLVVAVLIVLYIVCIGPLDYFLVRRVLRRMEATWLTFSATVVLQRRRYVLAYGLKGRELRVNQVDVVDFDAEVELVRGTCWANVFSPQHDLRPVARHRARWRAESSAPPRAALVDGPARQRLRRHELGRSAGVPLFTMPYDFSPQLDRLERVPIAIWSTKAFVGRWWDTAAARSRPNWPTTGGSPARSPARWTCRWPTAC